MISKKEKWNKPNSKQKPVHYLILKNLRKETLLLGVHVGKVLPVLSVDCGSSTGDPAASRSPRISVVCRRDFLRWLFNHLNARLKDPIRLLPRLPLPPCRSSMNTCSKSEGIRSPTESLPEDIVQPAKNTQIIMIHIVL